ncbi:hypothetical protein [Candidatus Enterovibrio altilux]|uniref:Uncharacterized protein n=1 Tax=Candidatus Enterovibrio altilux TaxID=1927128 RepID=A0A291B7F3_9GAMM|nr:hypothetical protein [Candidatus Enterovibrio luxaltus]ATF08907.1 hypothetical protein BTN50_0374 [Candidatus Enterovibrio luxaltus]
MQSKIISDADVQKDSLPNYTNKLRIISSKNFYFTIRKFASLLRLGGMQLLVLVPIAMALWILNQPMRFWLR